MLRKQITLPLIPNHAEIGGELLLSSLVPRSEPTFSSADPRILADVWSPLVRLQVPWVGRDPEDGFAHVVPVS